MKKISYILALTLLLASFAVQANLSVKTLIKGLPAGKAYKNAALAVQKLRNKYQFKNETYFNGFTKLANRDIENAIKPFGYFSALIANQKMKTPKHWLIVFTITPGIRVKVSQISITIQGDGKNNKHFKHLLSHLPIKTGQPLNTNKYTKIKERLSEIAAKFGYNHSKILKSKILINLNTHAAKIVIQFKSGPRARFGSTSFSDSPLNKGFLMKYLTYKKGDFYSSTKIQKSQQNLANSGYFSRVLASPVTGKKDILTTPVNILLTPELNQKYTFGVGYGTDTSYRGTVGININRVNTYGHKFNAIAQASKVTSSLVFNYLIPYPNPNRNLITLSGGFGYIKESVGSMSAQKLSASYSTQLGNWKQEISLSALNEKYHINPFDNKQTQATLIYPSINWIYKNSDKSLNPNNGVNIDFTIQGTPNILASNYGFYQLIINGKSISTFKPTHTRLFLHAEIGRTFIRNIYNLPLSLQLRTGGTQSIRGFTYNSIGPDKNLVLASIELQQKIYGNWYLSGFCDAGNATANYNEILKTLYVGSGPGIVWLSPIGMMELSLGFQIYAKGVYQHKKSAMIGFVMGASL